MLLKIILQIIFLICAILFAKLFTLKFAFLFFFTSLAFLVAFFTYKNDFLRSVSITLCVVLIVLAGTEIYLSYIEEQKKSNTMFQGTYGQNWTSPDPILGYRPKQEFAVTTSKKINKNTNEIIYDVTYTTNADGWRLTPQHPNAKKAVVFFGCSFTIWEGVNDQENYPFQVGLMLGENYQVYNLGFHGYGAHQALSYVESGLLTPILEKYDEIFVFFLNIDGHEYRSAGFSSWDKFGPKYIIAENSNHKVVRSGTFSDDIKNYNFIINYILEKLNNFSFIYKKIKSPKLNQQNKDAILKLQYSILSEANNILKSKEKKYNKAIPFTVLLYGTANKNITFLENEHISFIDTNNFFPEDVSNSKYKIEGDGHPNALAHFLLAKGITSHIQKFDKVESIQ